MNLANTGPPPHLPAITSRPGNVGISRPIVPARPSVIHTALAVLTLLLPLAGNALAAGQDETSAPTARPQEPILPLPQALPNPDIDKILLGERLFHDARLSSDNTIACANCHPIPRAGADGLALSPGVGGILGDMNSPTVFNSGYNLAQFWDGRAETLEDQVDGPVTNPVEMAGSWPEAIAKLEQDATLSAAFYKVFDRPWDQDGIQAAIAAYERSLLTPNSPFDRYLRGDDQALSAKQRKGYALFKSYGCIACHQGRNVGGNMYSQLGVVNDYFIGQESPSKRDLGRFNVTGDANDRHVFKVPGLRLVVRTAPYFHDGSIATLEEAISVMGRYQLGREIPAADIALIIDFLGSLEGQYQRLSR